MKKILNSGIFWTFIFGIVGIIITILFYEIGKKEREPVYVVKNEPSLIFDKENSTPKIKLISNDTIPINKNVYITNVVIWNNGNLEIKKTDIRKNFIVSFSDDAQILDFKIVKETNPNISKFKVFNIKNKLHIDWDFFDPNFGFELQIIYSGNKKSKLNIEGYVLGKKITEVVAKKDSSSDLWIFGLTILLSFLSAFFSSFISKFTITYSSSKIMKFMINAIIYLAVTIVIVGFAIKLYVMFLKGIKVPL